jgi:signal transduction histidine kinase
MKRFTNRPDSWIFYLVASFYFGAVLLRSILVYRGSPELGLALGMLLVGLILAASEPAITRRWSGYFLIYLLLQTCLVFWLLTLPGYPDFFASLFGILSIQAMARLNPRVGILWIALCTPVIALILDRVYGPQSIALALIYTAQNVFFGSYALATRRAHAAHLKNQALGKELQEANQQLEVYSTQIEQFAVARERNRLARELHDSVTQTVFSMTLTTQSALLLLDRHPDQVGAQLERLCQLARSALAEMGTLISELQPEKGASGGLANALRGHLAERQFPEGLAVSLEVLGDQTVDPIEERSLFRIAQEALNNIVKHAQASQAQIRLHLDDPFWMEIEDQGIGFDLYLAQNGKRVGLLSMKERAAEIDWGLHIITSPGAGTLIRVEKLPLKERQE